MNRLFAIAVMILVLVTTVYTEGIDRLIDRRDIRGIKEHVMQSHSKLKDIKLIISRKDEFPAGIFPRMLRFLETQFERDLLAEILISEDINERTYPYLIEYFRKKDLNSLTEFVKSNQNADVNHEKYVVMFDKWGILEDIFNSAHDSPLYFHAGSRLFQKTGDMAYLNGILEYGNYRLRETFSKSEMSEENRNKLLVKAIEHNGLEHFESIALGYAVYFPDSNMTYLFKGSKLEEAYGAYRRALKNGTGHGKLNHSILNAAAELFNGELKDARSVVEETPGDLTARFIEMMGALFNSDISHFRELAGYFLLAERNRHIRMKIIKILLISDIIDDGTFLRYYYKGNDEKTAQFIDLLAPQSPLKYEMLVKENRYEEADSIAEQLSDKENTALKIVIDMENNRDIDHSGFMRKFPGHPLNSIIRGYSK